MCKSLTGSRQEAPITSWFYSEPETGFQVFEMFCLRAPASATSTTETAAAFFSLKHKAAVMCWFPQLIVLSNVKQCSAKSMTMQEREPAKTPVNLEEIRAELKAKIEEEAYNKG